MAEQVAPGRRHRGPDGLQARRRADERQLEDQAPRHEAAGDGGQPPRAVRHDVHLGAARAEQARRPARQRGARRHARRGHLPRRRATRTDPTSRDSLVEEVESPEQQAAVQRGGRRLPRLVAARRAGRPRWSWSGTAPPPTRAEKRFSGGLASSNPGLTDEGRAQVREVAEWLAPLGEAVDAVVASPVRRTRESAEILAERLGLDLVEEPGFAEMEFGAWDGLTFAEVARAAPGRARGLARLARRGARAAASRSARSRSGCWPGCERVLDDVRRQDGRRGQPRDPDQDRSSPTPSTRRCRRVFRMELSTGVGQRRVVLRRAEPATASRAARCGSTTPSRPAPDQMLDPQRWSSRVRAR